MEAEPAHVDEGGRHQNPAVMVVEVVGPGRQRFHAVLRHSGCLPDRAPPGRRYVPAAGAAGSGKEKRPRKRSTACLLPSIFRSPELSASSIPRPS